MGGKSAQSHKPRAGEAQPTAQERGGREEERLLSVRPWKQEEGVQPDTTRHPVLVQLVWGGGEGRGRGEGHQPHNCNRNWKRKAFCPDLWNSFRSPLVPQPPTQPWTRGAELGLSLQVGQSGGQPALLPPPQEVHLKPWASRRPPRPHPRKRLGAFPQERRVGDELLSLQPRS